MSKKPNIFEYATKELSQDAFFAWLLNWANPKIFPLDDHKNKADNEKLHESAKDFIKFLLEKNEIKIEEIKAGRGKDIEEWAENKKSGIWHDLKKNENGNFLEELKKYIELDKLDKLTMKRKDICETLENIDIWAEIEVIDEIEQKYFIIIEDKILSVEHDYQLERYREATKILCKKIDHKYKIVLVYLKTGSSDSIYPEISTKKYRYVNRKRLLAVFNKEEYLQINNNIYSDFVMRIKSLEDSENEKTKSFFENHIGIWNDDNWQGFYQYLELTENLKKLEIEKMEYEYGWQKVVGNGKDKDFLGFLWRKKWKDYYVRLQIERKKLQFKIEDIEKKLSNEERLNVKLKWRTIIQKQKQIIEQENPKFEDIKEINISKASKRVGKIMTVATVPCNIWLGEDSCAIYEHNVGKVMDKLKNYLSFLDRCIQESEV